MWLNYNNYFNKLKNSKMSKIKKTKVVLMFKNLWNYLEKLRKNKKMVIVNMNLKEALQMKTILKMNINDYIEFL